MNEKKMQDALLEAIGVMIDNKLKKLKFNYYVDGVINKVNNDKTYSVLINGATYENIPSKNNFAYQVGDSVQILIKNGDWNKKFIDDRTAHNMSASKDYVVEQGTVATTSSGATGDWHYKKWSNGEVECWGVFQRSNLAVTTAIGSTGWFKSATLGEVYPSKLFKTVNYSNIKPVYWSSSSILEAQHYSIDGTTQTQWVARHTASNSTMTFKYTVNIKGTWK